MKKLINLFFLVAFYSLLISNYSMSQWFVQSIPTTNDLYSFQFIDANTAFAVGDSGTIIKTTNGGINWISQYSDSSKVLWSVKFLNSNTGFAVGGNDSDYFLGLILNTTNGGLNWNSQIINNIGFRRALCFINLNTGFAGGWVINQTLPVVYKTTNSGINWLPVTIANIRGVEYIFFVDSNTGWAVGDGTNSNEEVIIKTTNGGENWSVIYTVPNSWLSSIFFINANTGWLTGYLMGTNWHGLISKTTNGGINWFEQNQPNISELYEAKFVNENTGWVVGDVGTILKTTNGGDNWRYQYCPYTNWFWSMYLEDANTGWIVGGNGRVLKTTNGGGGFLNFSISGTVRYTDNNQPVTSGVVKAIKLNQNDASIIVYDTALIQSNGTYILHNVPQDSIYIGLYPNSGTTQDYVISYYPSAIDWHQATELYPTNNLTNIDLGAVRIQSTSAGNSVNGKVMRLTNSITGNLKDAVLYAKNGNTFVRCSTSDVNGVYHLPSLPTGNLKIIVNRLGFSNDSTTVNVTPSSNIDSINFNLFSNYTGIKPIDGLVPTDFKLYQNYPNPFNPVTKIKFNVAAHSVGQTFLSVYDLLGREIVTLVNENLNTGTYEVTFDGSNFASGIYFYKLETSGFVQTKKMLMIK